MDVDYVAYKFFSKEFHLFFMRLIRLAQNLKLIIFLFKLLLEQLVLYMNMNFQIL